MPTTVAGFFIFVGLALFLIAGEFIKIEGKDFKIYIPKDKSRFVCGLGVALFIIGLGFDAFLFYDNYNRPPHFRMPNFELYKPHSHSLN